MFDLTQMEQFWSTFVQLWKVFFRIYCECRNTSLATKLHNSVLLVLFHERKLNRSIHKPASLSEIPASFVSLYSLKLLHEAQANYNQI